MFIIFHIIMFFMQKIPPPPFFFKNEIAHLFPLMPVHLGYMHLTPLVGKEEWRGTFYSLYLVYSKEVRVCNFPFKYVHSYLTGNL